MRLLWTISTLLALLPLGGVLVHAQEVGGYAGAYLRSEALAQEAAMGGIYMPFTPNASAIFSNGSALARLEHSSAVLSASFLPQGQGLFLLGFGLKAGESAGIGFGMLRYGISEVESYSADERRLGTFSANDFAFSIGGGLAIGPANVGATLRYMMNNVGSVEGSGFGYSVDLSGMMEFQTDLARRDWMLLTVELNNIAGEMRDAHEQIPWDVRLGASYIYPIEDEVTIARPDPSGIPATRRVKPRAYLLGAAQAHLARFDSSASYSVALEAVPVPNVPIGLRAGASSTGDLAAGFFLTLPWDFARNLRLDFASRRDYHLGRMTHHVTLVGGF